MDTLKFKIEMANGESFVKRVNQILRYHARLAESAYQPNEIPALLRDSIKRALDNAEIYAVKNGEILSLDK